MKNRLLSSCVALLFFKLVSPMYATPLNQLSVNKFLDTLSQPTPEITGGAALSITTAIAANLCKKVAALNLKHHATGTDWILLQNNSKKVSNLSAIFAEHDIQTFKAYLNISKTPNASSLQTLNVQIASTKILISMLQEAINIKKIAQTEEKYSLPFFQSDAISAFELASGNIKALKALLTYDISTLPNKALQEQFTKKMNHLRA